MNMKRKQKKPITFKDLRGEVKVKAHGDISEHVFSFYSDASSKSRKSFKAS